MDAVNYLEISFAAGIQTHSTLPAAAGAVRWGSWWGMS
jgi:hypothetical protein